MISYCIASFNLLCAFLLEIFSIHKKRHSQKGNALKKLSRTTCFNPLTRLL